MQDSTLRLKTTRRGAPAIWESGGATTSQGTARIITSSTGEKIKPIFIPVGGPLACGDHAMFEARAGQFIIDVYQNRLCSPSDAWLTGETIIGELVITVSRVTHVYRDGAEWAANVEQITQYKRGEWAPSEPFPSLTTAITTAIKKSKDYHCRCAYWALLDGEQSNPLKTEWHR